MELLDKKSDKELLDSCLAELAKATNEIKCAQGDLAKAQSRLGFLVVLSNELIKRQGDKK